MRVAIAQTDIKLGDKDFNLSKALDIIEGGDADLFLFPELFTTGFDYDHLGALAEELPGETVEAVSRTCGESIVGGSILEKQGGDVYNTFILVSGKGLLGSYRKVHPFGEEKQHFARGMEPVVTETGSGKLGLAVCYDVRFPELFRELMWKGAEAVLVSAEFPSPRQEHWEVLLRARAIENQFFVLAANRVGAGEEEYLGGSLAIDPWGKVLARGGAGEEVLKVDVDLSLVGEIRKGFPVLGDVQIR